MLLRGCVRAQTVRRFVPDVTVGGWSEFLLKLMGPSFGFVRCVAPRSAEGPALCVVVDECGVAQVPPANEDEMRGRFGAVDARCPRDPPSRPE